MITRTPLRVQVTGDLYHGQVPSGATYVGRAAPGLRASKYANPFGLKRKFPRSHPLRAVLDIAVAEVTGIDTSDSQEHHDVIIPGTQSVAVAAYRQWLATRPDLIAAARAELAGRDLACWCKQPAPGEPDYCHAAVLMDVANSPLPPRHSPARQRGCAGRAAPDGD